ncbi:MAG: hypothetical protein ACP5FH_06535, partial [Terracidiphilus sp.]
MVSSVAWAIPPSALLPASAGAADVCQPPVAAAWAKPETITPVHVARYLDQRGAEAPVSANREMALLSHVYTKALRWGMAT